MGLLCGGHFIVLLLMVPQEFPACYPLADALLGSDCLPFPISPSHFSHQGVPDPNKCLALESLSLGLLLAWETLHVAPAHLFHPCLPLVLHPPAHFHGLGLVIYVVG